MENNSEILPEINSSYHPLRHIQPVTQTVKASVLLEMKLKLTYIYLLLPVPVLHV